MTFIDQILNFFVDFSKIIFSLIFFLILALFIIVFHIFAYFIRDKKHIKPFRNIKELQLISQNDLNEFPTVNIIVPAWKEGEPFRKCVQALTELSYSNIKVIINAGGSEETINIANSFKKYKNFEILLYQKKGEGKIKAINDCLEHVSDGLIYLIDADIYLTDNIFFYVIYHLINKNHKIVTSSLIPHNSIIKKDLVKYLYINRNRRFRHIFTREVNFFGPHACLRHEVIEDIKKFPEKKASDDNRLIGAILLAKGYKIYFLYELCVESFTFPIKIKPFIQQNAKWIENRMIFLSKSNRLRLMRFFLIALLSIYLFIFPVLIFLNIYLFLIGLLLLFSIYLKRIRKIIVYKKSAIKDYDIKLSPSFFVKMIFYIYIDALIRIFALFELIFFRKNYKKRKNLI
ncbi:MAG: glycosyltransferase [Promethearchaeota archaeon]